MFAHVRLLLTFIRNFWRLFMSFYHFGIQIKFSLSYQRV